MSTAKKFAGQTAVYGLSTIVSRLLNFILTPIYTSTFATNVYGVFTTMFSWAAILNPFLAFGMETTFFRYLNKRKDDKETVYNNAFGTILTLCLLFAVIAIPLIDQIADEVRIGDKILSSDYVLYVKYFIAIVIMDAICVVPFARIRGEGRPGKFGLIKLINVISFLALNLMFIYVIPLILKNKIWGWEWIATWYTPKWLGYVFLSNLLASAITMLLLLPELLLLRFKFNWPLLKEMLVYSWPVVVANFSFIINEHLDKLMLGKLLPSKVSGEAVGIYSACAKIAVFLNIFIQAFRLGAEPFFFNHAGNKNSGQTYAKIMNYFVIAMCLIFVGLIANIQILKYFINERFWAGLPVVPLLLFGYLNLGIYMNLSVWYKLSDQTKYGLYISGLGALFTIVFNLMFIPSYGYMASAWVSLGAYTLMSVLSYVWGQKNYPIPYNLKKNLAYTLSSAVIVYLSFVIFSRNIFVGNALLVAYAATAFYFERKELLSIFKR
ncbi:oligosaccharide flippase family protein [Mucilaginibacter sp. JRF]|uniref:lipopolysaccharide biosynthesis protein n=1 Tax=Mucilaginibacter sp. JRF TaxID=2780088 RepID=UPI00187E121E|nr:oligosaccharide flippase family protein [Mucilaginibacter sp. JRF]MBE9585331.1 oligosaccharide flippase family protein [Mucilaginibacter sp. JRF]